MFLSAKADREADAALEAILAGAAGDALRRTLHRRWPEKADELYGAAALRLTERLRALRETPGSDPIRNLEGYAVAVAENTGEDALRARNPERARLKSRLRYLFETATHLSLWEQDGQLVVGERVRTGVAPKTLPENFHALQSSPLADVVAQALSAAGGPVTLSALTDALARAWGLSEQPLSEADVLGSEPGSLFDRFQSAESEPGEKLQQAEALARLWGEIRRLPERQRAALLLNLRDDGGRGVIELLLTRIPRAEIEAAAGLWSDEEKALWDTLPLDDNTIAARLGVTRQQVINLRKVARQRLARYLSLETKRS
jgi:RNA polymerase sigma factor (sigma-70 family)